MAIELFLWDHPVSSYAQKVRIALREKKIPFRLETPKGGGTGNLAITDPNFVLGNNRLEVPALVLGDSGVKIFDSTIILEYLEDKYPDIPLRPLDPLNRAKARMIEEVCDSQGEAINWGAGEITAFKRAEDDKAAKMLEQAQHQVSQFHEWLTTQLGDAQWFGGERLGWADVCVWPIINRSTSYNLEPAPGTALRNWYERAKEQESVRSVFEEFQAATKGAKAGAMTEALKNGSMRRQYRDHRLEWMIKSGGIDIVKEGLEKNNIRFCWPHALS